ncbi:zinc-ribbon domain-containing protein [Caballeronia sp. NK8]|nr:zinc-ribbon domain-containing protein [Caballeronia sp. NK8]
MAVKANGTSYMALATRCPHCETVFKLDPHLLAPHDGRVRCGHCQEVFDAAHHRFELPDEPAAAGVAQHAAIIDDDVAVGPTTSSPDASARAPVTPVTSEAPLKPRPFAPRKLDLDTPSQPVPPFGTKPGEDSERTVYVDSPAFANASGPARSAPPRTEPAQSDAANEPSALPSEPDRLKQFIRVRSPHPDAANAAQGGAAAPLGEPPVAPFAGPVDDRAEPFIGPAPQLDAPPARPAPEPPAASAWRNDEEPAFSAKPPAPARRTSANEAFPVIRESREARESRAPVRPAPSKAKRVVGIIVAVLLALLLLVQLAWWQRETVMVYVPGSHSLYSDVCDQIGCTISPPRNIDGLQIESSGLRQVDGPHKLELKLSLRNRLDVALAYPALELTLLDDKNNVAIRRVLWPQDYARPGTIFAVGLPPQSAQPVVVRLDTGDAVAANYRVQVFYP